MECNVCGFRIMKGNRFCCNCGAPNSRHSECPHKDVRSYADLDTLDHVVICRDCRRVVHWCNDTEDQWRDLENSRTSEQLTRKTLEG